MVIARLDIHHGGQQAVGMEDTKPVNRFQRAVA
jgi:hypothetical protein